MKKEKIQKVIFTTLVKDTSIVALGEKFILNDIDTFRTGDSQFTTYPKTLKDLVIAVHLQIRMERHSLEVIVDSTGKLFEKYLVKQK